MIVTAKPVLTGSHGLIDCRAHEWGSIAMQGTVSNNDTARISLPAAGLAIVAATAALLLLASLHVLSPEFDPSWRMVSEYANGHYGWVLSLMFAAWE